MTPDNALQYPWKAWQKIRRLARNRLLVVNLEAYYVLETDLDAPAAGIWLQLPANVVIRKLSDSAKDIDDLIPIWSDYRGTPIAHRELRNTIRRYLDKGDECFCAVIDGEIVGMLWVGYANNRMLKKMAARDGLAPDEAIVHRGFVRGAYRGRKLHIVLNEAILDDLRRRGFRRIRRYVGINNIASIINNFRVNDRCRTLYHVEVHLAGLSFNFFPGYHNQSIPLKKKKVSRDSG
jgi:hypothetical protein